MPKKQSEIDPIAADFDEVAESIVAPAPPETNNNNDLVTVLAKSPAPSKQLALDLSIERDTLDQMQSAVAGMVGKRLMYRDLIA